MNNINKYNEREIFDYESKVNRIPSQIIHEVYPNEECMVNDMHNHLESYYYLVIDMKKKQDVYYLFTRNPLTDNLEHIKKGTFDHE